MKRLLQIGLLLLALLAGLTLYGSMALREARREVHRVAPHAS